MVLSAGPPEAVERPSSLLQPALWVMFAAVLLVFATGLLEPFDGPKAAIVRTLGAGLLVAGAFVTARRAARPRFWAIDAAMAAWLAAEILATLFARSPSLATFGEWEQQEGLLTSLGLAGAWLGARCALRDERSWERTLDVWFGAMALACAFAYLQALGLDPTGWVRVATLGGAMRPFGTLGHPNLLGLQAGAAAAAAVARALAAERRRAVYAVAALWLAGAVLLTLSRGAWLGLAAGVAVALLLAPRARAVALPWRRVALAGAAAVAILALVITVTGGWPRLAARVAELLSPASGSGRSRLEIWRAALAEWKARPWLGQGPDNFYLAFHRYQTPAYWRFEWGGYALHAHSIYLHQLATRGLIGLLAAAAVVATAVAGLSRGWAAGGARRGLVAAIAAGLVAIAVAGAFGAGGIPGAFTTALLLAGAAWLGAPAASAPESAAAGRRVRRVRNVPGAGTPAAAILAGTLAALLVGVVSWRALIVSHRLWMGRDSLDELPGPVSPRMVEVYELVASRLQPALREAPWDDLGPRLLSEALTVSSNGVPGREGRLVRATEVASEAIRRQPLRPDAWRRLGDALASRVVAGETALAPACDSAFARAVELAPCDAYLLAQWSRARLALGRPRDAREPVQRAMMLYPDRGNAEAILAEAELALGDSAAARRRIDHALALTWYDDGGAHDAALGLRAALSPRSGSAAPAR